MPRKTTIKEVLESVVEEMVDNGIYWPEVQAQFEKLFILASFIYSVSTESNAP